MARLKNNITSEPLTLAEWENISDDARYRLSSDLFVGKYTGKTKFKFETGRLVVTEKVLDRGETTKKLARARDKTPSGSFGKFLCTSFTRYRLCDWGDVSQENRDANQKAIKCGGEIRSIFTHPEYPAIYIMTETKKPETLIALAEEL